MWKTFLRTVIFSASTVHRILDSTTSSRQKFLKAISIDEFKGNSATGKYQCILVTPLKHKILDILPDQTPNHLVSYFYSIPKSETITAFHTNIPAKILQTESETYFNKIFQVEIENRQACDLMLLYNDDLRRAHFLKEKFYDICQNPSYSEQRKDYFELIKMAENSGIPEFEKCANTYRNWSKEILNDLNIYIS